MERGQIDLFSTTLHAEYSVEEKEGGVLFLVDTGHTKTRSVTNDAESVIASLHGQYGDLSGRKILYQDSDGNIDEILVRTNKFAGFRPGPNRAVQGPEELGIF